MAEPRPSQVGDDPTWRTNLRKAMKKNWGKMRDNIIGEWGKNEEMFLSCPPKVECITTPLVCVRIFCRVSFDKKLIICEKMYLVSSQTDNPDSVLSFTTALMLLKRHNPSIHVQKIIGETWNFLISVSYVTFGKSAKMIKSLIRRNLEFFFTKIVSQANRSVADIQHCHVTIAQAVLLVNFFGIKI